MQKILIPLLNLIFLLIEQVVKAKEQRDAKRRQNARNVAEANPEAFFNAHFDSGDDNDVRSLHTDANHSPQLPQLQGNKAEHKSGEL